MKTVQEIKQAMYRWVASAEPRMLLLGNDAGCYEITVRLAGKEPERKVVTPYEFMEICFKAGADAAGA